MGKDTDSHGAMELHVRVKVRVGALHPTPTPPQADWRLVRERVVGNPSKEERVSKKQSSQTVGEGMLSHEKGWRLTQAAAPVSLARVVLSEGWPPAPGFPS